MTDNTKAAGLKIVRGSIERAPFIFFGGVATYGITHGVIQIELVSNVIITEGTGTRADVLSTGHLRCSPTAAVELRTAIDKALELLALPAAESIQSGKLN